MIKWTATPGGPYRSLIKLAEIEIKRAEDKARTKRLEQAKQKLQEAKAACSAGNYVEARKLAQETLKLTGEATTGRDYKS